jgi:septal ring-binding cell division protein DamX
MGRMLASQPGIDPLHYEENIDPELQRLFQMPSAPGTQTPTNSQLNFWPFRTAWAKSNHDRLNRWVPKRDELPEYLSLVHDLLTDTATETTKTANLDSSISTLYGKLVLATAWQESCWRQYMIKQKKVVPLRSNTGDAGLMQMNERVWRGFYDVEKLRWDIAYNARAGTEVLLKYLLKYALKKGEHKHHGGLNNLARATYSAYNGGPGQVSRYRNPSAAPALKKIDTAFWKKYQLVNQGNAMHVSRCLGGDAVVVASVEKSVQSNPKNVSSSPDKKEHGHSTKQAGKDWILAQNERNYTLQLAVLSTLEAATKLSDEQPVQGVFAIYQLDKKRQGLFAVLYGSYKTRSEADKVKQSFKKLKPWVRQFKEIQQTLKP